MDAAHGQPFPNRRFFDSDQPIPLGFLDDYGLLSHIGVKETRPVKELLSMHAVMVVSPPWYGKTFVMKGLHAVLSNEPSRIAHDESKDIIRSWRTAFHEFGDGCENRPDWWEAWSHGRERACWIIDAVDEDMADRKALWAMLNAVQALDVSARDRLHLILTCRQAEQSKKVAERLAEIYPFTDRDGCRIVTLAPPDAAEAEHISGGHEQFERVKRIINNNDLGHLAGRPAIIRYMAKRLPEEAVNRSNIWGGLLKEMLRSGERERESEEYTRDLDHVFDAACRAAVVDVLGGLQGLAIEPGAFTRPTTDGLFGENHRQLDRMRRAAGYLKRTGVFRVSGEVLQFSEQHVKEWSAAFGLEEVRLGQLRTLLSVEGKPIERLGQIAANLCEVSMDPIVREWIVGTNGGVPPSSDSASWTTAETRGYLDRLLKLARDSAYGLRIWDNEKLESLHAPGLTRELMRRLSDDALSRAEKVLLLDVARACRAFKIAPIVVGIIRDEKHGDDVQSTAGWVLLEIGSKEDFAGLAEFVRAAEPTTREGREVVANVIRGLMRFEIWGFREAYEWIPAPDPEVGDGSSLVEIELERRMKPDDARWILDGFDWEAGHDQRWGEGRVTGRRRNRDGVPSLVAHALEVLLEECEWTAEDVKRLCSPVLARDQLHQRGRLSDRIVEAMSKSSVARRGLFQMGAERYPDEAPNWAWHLRFLLTAEDAEWVADLAEGMGNTNQWIWQVVLALSEKPGVAECLAQRIRERAVAVVPDMVAQWDKMGERQKEREAEVKRERAKQETRESKKRWSLADLVEKYLSADELTDRQRLHNLSWACFQEDHLRPRNVLGEFDELPEDFRGRVLQVCAEALRIVEPTPIPDGKSFHSGMLYEGVAFTRVVRAGAFGLLTSTLIEKWLPAAIVFSLPERQDVLAACIASDRVATEDALLKNIIREVRSGSDSIHGAWSLPIELWSDRIAVECAAIVRNAALPLPGRCSLLRVLGVRSPHLAGDLGREWLEELCGRLTVGNGTPTNGREDRFLKGADRIASNPLTDDDRRDASVAAIDALYFDDPEAGIGELEHAVEKFGGGVLENVIAIDPDPWGRESAVTQWGAGVLERLCRLLHSAYPSASDPDYGPGGHMVSRADDLRQLRAEIPRVLFERNEVDGLTSLERLAEEFEEVRNWYSWARSKNEAAFVLVGVRATEAAINWKHVVRLLDDERYRLIRNSADLQQAIIEVLREIESSAKHHLAMLYRHVKHRWVRDKEDALQAYIHTRLTDLLPRRLDDSDVAFVNRETLVRSKRKQDIKVECKSYDAPMASVIVEVKWSEDPRVGTSLSSQLGKLYLDETSRHGVYLVGWTGKWKWPLKLKKTRPGNSVSDAESRFQRQADSFSKSHPTYHIVPVVIDIRREESRTQRP